MHLHSFSLALLCAASLSAGTLVTCSLDGINVQRGESECGMSAWNAAVQASASYYSVSSFASCTADFGAFASADSTWTDQYQAREVLTWWIDWGYLADASLFVVLNGEYVPIPDYSTGEYFTQTVEPGVELNSELSTLDYDGGSAHIGVQLISAAAEVPEPGTWGMLLLGGFTLLLRTARPPRSTRPGYLRPIAP